MIEFRVLGSFQAVDGDQPVHLGPPKARQLLAVLVLSRAQFVHVDTLIDRLWGDHRPATARSITQVYVSQLRKALPGLITTVAAGYLMDIDPDQVDLHRFRRLVRESRSATGPHRRDLLRQALGLWRDKPLCDLPDDVRDRLCAGFEAEWLDALEARFDAELAVGAHAEVVSELSLAVRQNPLREGLCASLMTALYRCGRTSEALAVYRDARSLIVEELGMEPAPTLQQLQQAILYGDDTVLWPAKTGPVAAATVPAPAQIPADLPDFVGREAELARIGKEVAVSGGAVSVVIVSAPGGAGKTALTVHAAHLVRQHFPDGQLYADLEGSRSDRRRPGDVLAAMLRELDPGRNPPRDVAELTAAFRTALAGRRMLVLFDDARDATQVRPLVAACPGCAVLVTSRNNLPGLAGASHLQLPLMSQEDSVRLFASAAGEHRIVEDPAAVDDIVQHCGQLPLALRIAASRLAVRPAWTVRALADRLARPTRLRELAAGGVAVRTSFELSYQQLGAEAAAVFRLLAWTGGTRFRSAAAAAMMDAPEPTVERELEDLVDAHLTLSVAPGRYGYHDLLRLYARELSTAVDPLSARHAALTRLFGYVFGSARNAVNTVEPASRRRDIDIPGKQYAATFARPDDAVAWLTGEWELIVATANCTAGVASVTANMCCGLAGVVAQYAQFRGLWPGWRAVAVAALDKATAEGDADAEATSLVSLGGLAMHCGQFAQAQEHARRAADLYRLLGNWENQVRAVMLLALAQARAGLHADSIKSARRGLRLHREHGAPPRLAALLWNSMSEAQLGLGSPDAALRSLRQAERIARDLGDEAALASMAVATGDAYRALGDPDAALRYYEAGLAGGRALTMLDLQANAHQGIGKAELAASRPDPARRHLEEAVEIWRRMRVSDKIAAALDDLADLLDGDGQSERATACRGEACVLRGEAPALGPAPSGSS